MTNDGGPAFPQITTEEKDSEIYEDTTYSHVSSHGGLSIRDYFAAKAMQGFAASDQPDWHQSNEERAKKAYEQADAMIAARNKSLAGKSPGE